MCVYEFISLRPEQLEPLIQEYLQTLVTFRSLEFFEIKTGIDDEL